MQRFSFFSTPNHRATAVEQLDPTTFVPDIPESVLKTKSTFKRWSAQIDTKHAFVSCVEGSNPHEIVSKTNPPAVVHGFVVDYDSPSGDDPISFVRSKGGDPTYISRSFSGHVRLTWLLPEPVPVTQAVAAAFLARLHKSVNAEKLFPGYDRTCANPNQYLEVGSDWQKVGEPMAESRVTAALFQAYNEAGYVASDIEIPIAVVAPEVERRWPGRWKGAFELEARGPLFWIDDGIDREGCCIKPDGIICYSDRAGKGFVSWRELLGQSFVSDYEEKKISESLSEYFYDGDAYWRTGTGYGIRDTQEALVLNLRKMGFATKPKKGAPLSEVEEAIHYIQNAGRVDGAAPCLFDSRTVVVLPDNRKIVNTSRIRAIAPASEGDPSDWPWLKAYLATLIDPAPCDRGINAYDYFWAWCARAYTACYKREPLSGQAFILAGDAGIGKTLFARGVMGKLCGGWADAGNFLTAKTNFNKEISERPIWAVDDSESAVDFKEQRRFTELLKKAVANPAVDAHAKGRDSQSVPWTGRVILTVNLDAHSLSVIPNLDQSNRDKLCAFQTPVGGTKIEFPSNAEVDAILSKELPFFARWLLDYVPNPAVVGKSRYGVRSYFHPAVERAARDASPRQQVLEIIDLFVQELRAADDNRDYWIGSSAKLVGEMSEMPMLRSFQSLRSASMFARDLSCAEEYGKVNNTVRPITSESTGTGKTWKISLDPKYDHDYGDGLV